ncbi:MAG: heme-binding protein [Azospirillum sp.]|nr:heme-binding protein [Azospirillum sp.]
MLGLGLPAAAAAEGLFTVSNLTPDTALKLAQATLADCHGKGYQVAVAVVDRSGVPQVVLRDRFGGPHTVDTAIRKAWTAVSFRTNTKDLSDQTKAEGQSTGLRQITNAIVLGGGVPVEAKGSIVGGVGVSGAPGGEEDHGCALAGLEAILLDLEF